MTTSKTNQDLSQYQPKNIYSPAFRTLACQACTTPAIMPTEGGTVHCNECGIPLKASSRPDTTVPKSYTPYQQRLAELNKQYKKLSPLSATQRELLPGSNTKLTEALILWSDSYRKLSGNAIDIQTAELFVTTTLDIVNRPVTLKPFHCRALLESALETVTLPSLRQRLRAELAYRAARIGDIDSAKSWIDGCDPDSSEVFSDNGYLLANYIISSPHAFTPAYLDEARLRIKQQSRFETVWIALIGLFISGASVTIMLSQAIAVGWYLSTIAIVVFIGLGVALLAIPANSIQQTIADKGTPGVGRVSDIKWTFNKRITGAHLTVQVAVHGYPPFEVQKKLAYGHSEVPDQLKVGMEFALLWHPGHPGTVVPSRKLS